MIYLYWDQGEDMGDSSSMKKGKSAIPLLAVSIKHREGCFPLARVIAVATSEQLLQKHVFLVYEKEESCSIIFRGSIIKQSSFREDGSMVLDLTSEDENSMAFIELEQQSLKKFPGFDPLFVDDSSQNDLEEILEGYTFLPHWGREGNFCFSDILDGSKKICLGDSFLHSSLKTRLIKKPIHHVSVELNVQWVQEFSTLLNLSSAIMAALPDPFITTLTPHHLQKFWWPSSHTLPHTAYRVAQSSLIPFDPEIGGVAYRYPPLSEAFSLDDRFPVYLPRFWFIPHLVLGMKYRQKRSETLSFDLKSTLQPLLNTENSQGRSKKIRLRLQDISKDSLTPLWKPEVFYEKGDSVQHEGSHYLCETPHRSSSAFTRDEQMWGLTFFTQSPLRDKASPTYFLTERGFTTMIHAVERAQSILAMGARIFETTFEVDFDAVKHLDCDTTIQIKDARLPHGEVVGKVVAYDMRFKNGVQRVFVTLLSSIGVKGESVHEEAWRITPSGVRIKDPTSQYPTEGVLNPRELRGEDVLKKVIVTYSVAEQNEIIGGKKFHTLAEVESLLRQHATHLEIQLLPLIQRQKLHHTIHLGVASFWNPPAQVML